MSTCDQAQCDRAQLRNVAESAAALLDSSPHPIPDETLRRLFTSVAKRYAARRETRPELAAVEQSVTATEVTACCLGLLRAADLQVFELGFWSRNFGIGSSQGGSDVTA